MELLDFQQEASNQIIKRLIEYFEDPVRVGRQGGRRVPFLQFLSSITASGKTLVLADAVSGAAKHLPLKPIVLWLSKASVVVEQTFASLQPGGAYHDLIEDFDVRTLADYDEAASTNSDASFLVFATVGAFNQGSKGDGSLNVFKSAIDEAERSTWESLIARPNAKGLRRPLLVVYDEAHNLSDQQTTLLLELEPDAFLLATATSKLPERFQAEVIDQLKKSGGLSDDELLTQVDAKRVAESGLIKNEINLIGRQAPMEDVVAEMVRELRLTAKAAASQALTGQPKAVYVCKTNVIEDTGERDNPKQPFNQRRAPPILIWRQLTEKLKVDPSEVAVYSDLKVDKAHPLPAEFILLRSSDGGYEQLTKGSFRHVIFNQSLQEGWDDPFVYAAYIDKSMGSRIQAEQIVGRLLRQPGRTHYKAQRLNTAQIFVRVDSAGVFDEVVHSVEKKIAGDGIDIRMTVSRPGHIPKKELAAKKKHFVPRAGLVTDRAKRRIDELVEAMSDYSNDQSSNTRGKGKRVSVQRVVGTKGGGAFEWEEYGESATVLARWLFAREVDRVHKGAKVLTVTTGPGGSASKFDARIGFGSPAAAHISDVAKKVGEAFVDQVYLKLRKPNPYEVGPVLVDPKKLKRFKHALHDGYDDLNEFEKAFAAALDSRKATWCRNPARSGYSIPLPEPGRTQNFFPDFLVWKSGDVFALETKGSFLASDAARKLVSIRPAEKTARVFVRFVAEGKVGPKGAATDSSGYTVVGFKPNGERDYTACETLAKALALCLEPDV